MDKFWVDVLMDISEGSIIESRNGGSKEIIGFSDTLVYSRQSFLFNVIRRLDPSYACGEFLWYLSMTTDTTFLQKFAPGYTRFCEDGVNAFGAYGHRWVKNSLPNQDQLKDVIETLKTRKNSRQVVMTMWHGTDLSHALKLDKKDIPCTLTHQFMLRGGYLHMITNMRSNDAWLGLPYDVFCNTQLQKLIATELDCSVGPYTHNVGSMHYYDKHNEKIEKILDSTKKELGIDIEAPISLFTKGSSTLSLKNQIEAAIAFVDNGELSSVNELHTVLRDSALVCRIKFVEEKQKELSCLIYDPQLKKAVEVFYGLC